MGKLIWENKVIMCDICRERPMKSVVKIKGVWKGVCCECEPKEKEKKCIK